MNPNANNITMSIVILQLNQWRRRVAHAHLLVKDLVKISRGSRHRQTEDEPSGDVNFTLRVKLPRVKVPLVRQPGEGGKLLGLGEGKGTAHAVHNQLRWAKGPEGVRTELAQDLGLGHQVSPEELRFSSRVCRGLCVCV